MNELNEDFTNLYKRWKGGKVRKEDKFDYNLIDLGLPSGTLWMDRNIGAETLVDYGGYYAWGETEEKDDYSWDTYKFGNYNALTKYNKKDGKTVLEHEDDVVYKKTRGKCHIPTVQQIDELIDETNNEWIEDYKGSGVNGRLFTSKKNDNSIFFPAAGHKGSSVLNYIGCFFYIWSSSIDEDDDGDAWRLGYTGDAVCFSHIRLYGYSVRGCKG